MGSPVSQDRADREFEALLRERWAVPSHSRKSSLSDDRFESLLGAFRELSAPAPKVASRTSGARHLAAPQTTVSDAGALADELARVCAGLHAQPGGGAASADAARLAFNLQLALARGQGGKVLVLNAGGQKFCLRIEDVVEVLEYRALHGQTTASLRYGAERLVLRSARDWCAVGEDRLPPMGGWIVVVTAGERPAALWVEAVDGLASVTLTPAGSLWHGARAVRAVAVDDNGAAMPLLDLAALLKDGADHE
jgi:chemotaxis signal transduction protein